MSLPAIDIPVKLPFEVPLLVHPIFVHFAIAIPVIVFLLELANIKARNRTVSVTSLFLMTLGLLVFAGAFFSGKADGSHAYALLSPEVQEELKFHKLLGIYLVYGMGALYLFKILAMLIKANWARDIFLVLLLVFVGTLFKQGKDGGELVYKYGVNVEAVTTLQNRIDEMEYDIEDLKEELKKAKGVSTEKPAEEAPAPTSEEPSAEPESSANEPAATETPAEEAHEAVQEATQSVQEAAKAAEEEAGEAAEEAVQEASHEATQKIHNAVEEAAEAAHEATEKGAETSEEANQTPENTTPVEIPMH